MQQVLFKNLGLFPIFQVANFAAENGKDIADAMAEDTVEVQRAKAGPRIA